MNWIISIFIKIIAFILKTHLIIHYSQILILFKSNNNFNLQAIDWVKRGKDFHWFENTGTIYGEAYGKERVLLRFKDWLKEIKPKPNIKEKWSAQKEDLPKIIPKEFLYYDAEYKLI